MNAYKKRSMKFVCLCLYVFVVGATIVSLSGCVQVWMPLLET